MGNRVNYGFKTNWGDTPDEQVFYLYMHWGPEKIKKTLAQALDKTRRRWDDPAYATRWTVLQLMDANNDLDLDETGTGFTVGHLSDNEHDVWVVDWHNKIVVKNKGEKTLSLEDFVSQYK
jgi:hypothetical protein